MHLPDYLKMENQKSVSQKMGVVGGSRGIVLNAGATTVKALQLPELNLASRISGLFDYIHFFATSKNELLKRFSVLKSHLKERGMVWISWPKGGQLETDLTLKEIIRIGYDHGLVESKTMSIDNTWSAIKFTHPLSGKIYNNKYGKLKND